LLTQAIKKNIFASVSPVEFENHRVEPAAPNFVQEPVLPYDLKSKREYETTRESSEFWQLHNTYILAQTKSGMIILDQHVAHERIIYESIMKAGSHPQRLLFPITLNLTPEEFAVYTQTKSTLEEFGLEFKEFSSRTIVIEGLPADVKVSRQDLIGLFSEIGGLGKLRKEKGEVAKVIACRSAIKAGMKLSPAEMQSLVDRLFACENPYTCPHGRPVVLKFTLEELGYKFGRT
jgi:DNA mismatch repair protein MutL